MKVNRSARRHERHAGGDGGAHERWLITYADMITVLLALFICMYAISVVNLGKFDALAASVRSGFGGDLPGMHPDRLGIPSEGAQVLPSVFPAGSFELMTTVAANVRARMSSGEAENVEFLSDGGVVKVRVRADDVLFARGSADVSPRARRTLAAIAQAIEPLPYDIRVEGHTCDLPIHTARFPSNWELSAQRAINVVLHFVRDLKVSPARLSAAGYAETVPVAPNDTERSRVRNRRIDIVLLERGGAGGRRDGRVPDRPGAVHVGPPSVRLNPAMNGTAPGEGAPGGSPQ